MHIVLVTPEAEYCQKSSIKTLSLFRVLQYILPSLLPGLCLKTCFTIPFAITYSVKC